MDSLNSIVTPLNSTPPLLSGLIWQAISRDDLMALVKLADECQLVDGGLAFLNRPYDLLERFFPDALGVGIGAFDASDQIVACATVHINSNSDTERALIVGQVHPELRNKGIGAYLMRWSELQAQSLFTVRAVNKRLRVTTESLTEPADRLYRIHGYQSVDEQLVMRRDLQLPLPDRSMPSDISFTTWQPALADQFFQAYHAAFRERPGFPGFTAAEWVDNWTNEHFRPEWSLLARAGDLPVGFLTATTNPPFGFVMQVGVIPAQRRRGLGSALIVETMRMMKAAGEKATEVTVNINNPGMIQTCTLLGFVTVGRRAKYERIIDQ